MNLAKFKTLKPVIMDLIYKNPINDANILADIETTLINKRGYVFKMPKPESGVIALMSGGLDTTVVIEILMGIYGLKVYPLVVDRGLLHKQKVKRSIGWLSSYFGQKYPKLFHKPFVIKMELPPREVARVLKSHENDIIENQIRKGIPLQPIFYANLGMYYAKYLNETTGINVSTIIGGWLPSNSLWYGYESYTSIRSIMLNMCVTDNDFKWQFSSLPMEREEGFYFDKDVVVKIGSMMSVPMEQTWTCFMGKKYHCGNCPPCDTRADAFLDAKIPDKTIYLPTYRQQLLVNKIKRKILTKVSRLMA